VTSSKTSKDPDTDDVEASGRGVGSGDDAEAAFRVEQNSSATYSVASEVDRVDLAGGRANGLFFGLGIHCMFSTTIAMELVSRITYTRETGKRLYSDETHSGRGNG